LYQQWFARDDDAQRFITPPVEISRAKTRAWCEKYPRGRAADLFRKYEEVQARGGLNVKELEVTAFVKIEKKVDVGLDGVKKLATPRLVCAHSDEVLVLSCPFFGEVYTQMRDAWDGSGKILYSAGRSREYIGDCMVEWIGRCRHPLYFSIDAEKFDGHCKDHLTGEWKHMLGYKGASPLELIAMCDPGSKVVTPHGVYATVPEEERPIYSGGGDTNLKGSFVTAGSFWSNPALASVRGGTAVCGDDNGGVVDVEDEGVFKDVLLKHYAALGLKQVPIISRHLHDIDFCSMLFWPVEEGRRLVMGAKPGRMISRIGWVVENNNEPNLRGMVIGLLNDNNHVPVLGPFLRHLHKLTRGQRLVRGKKWEGNHVSSVHHADQSTIDFFTRRYDCTIEDMQALERLLCSISRLPAIVNSPLLDRMVLVDEA